MADTAGPASGTNYDYAPGDAAGIGIGAYDTYNNNASQGSGSLGAGSSSLHQKSASAALPAVSAISSQLERATRLRCRP